MKRAKATSKIDIELDDAIILLLGTSIKGLPWNPEIKGITRLEKLLFLMGRETEVMESIKDGFEFEPAPFGPFSSRVYQVADLLIAAGLVAEHDTIESTNLDSWEAENIIGLESSAFLMRHFGLTKRGEDYYNVLSEELDRKSLDEIVLFKTRFAFLPIRQLVRYTYSQYPEYTLVS